MLTIPDETIVAYRNAKRRPYPAEIVHRPKAFHSKALA
jgi:hypothetical protein